MFIKDSSCISPQITFDNRFFEQKVIVYKGNKYISEEPNYKELIPFKLLRRMGRATRIGIGAGISLLQRNTEVDGIIIGTANGGLEDSIKFLNQIIKYEEGKLTPTNFIQSTPNSISGNLAIMSQNNKYNITHVHKGLAFENALLDAFLLFEEKKVNSVLVGNIEELSDYNYNIDFLSDAFKSEEITSDKLLNSQTKGTVCGEGAAMFILDAKESVNSVQIVDVEQMVYPTVDDIQEKIIYFIERNNLLLSDIDGLVLGLNGDNRTDYYYHTTIENIFPNISVFSYKNLVGEYPSSSAFATWLASQILQKKNVPEDVKYKSVNSDIKTILVYNHFEGTQHGLILLKSTE